MERAGVLEPGGGCWLTGGRPDLVEAGGGRWLPRGRRMPATGREAASFGRLDPVEAGALEETISVVELEAAS